MKIQAMHKCSIIVDLNSNYVFWMVHHCHYRGSAV